MAERDKSAYEAEELRSQALGLDAKLREASSRAETEGAQRQQLQSQVGGRASGGLLGSASVPCLGARCLLGGARGGMRSSGGGSLGPRRWEARAVGTRPAGCGTRGSMRRCGLPVHLPSVRWNLRLAAQRCLLSSRRMG